MDLFTRIDDLRRRWTDQYVTVKPERPELQRFANIVGRIVTVNCNGKAVIDFQDGGWYDITASEEYLNVLPAAEACEYLRRVAIRDALTFEIADYVRTYVARNLVQKPAKFAPPPGAEFVM